MSDPAAPIVDLLQPADLVRCAEIEKDLFAADSPWPLSGFVSELRAPHTTYFAVRPTPGAPPVGYAGISLLGSAGDHECEVHTIGVEAGHQGHGYGAALLTALLRVADTARAPVFLEVRTDNGPAIALYERNGFEIAGVRRHYYQPSGADAYTMVRAARPDMRAADDAVGTAESEGHANS